jgi:quinol monooxygenase YgiN
MKHILNYRLFESNGDEIELFEDLLQEYFDEFKIYPKSEVDERGLYGSDEANGDYTIRRVSTTFFKIPGFPDHSSGIHIQVNLRKHDALREKVSIGLSSFIRRIQKMGYKVDCAYDDTFTVKFYIAIIDKKVEESVRYLNSGFEISEDDFTDWSYEHDLDPNGFSAREKVQLESWAKQMNCKPLIYEGPTDEAKKSIVSLNDGYLRIDVCKFKDEWFTLFIEEGETTFGNAQEYYLFETWEDLSERINKHLDSYLKYYSDEDKGEFDETFESVQIENYEVSEDDFMDWSYEHNLDKCFNKREIEQILSWSRKVNQDRHDFFDFNLTRYPYVTISGKEDNYKGEYDRDILIKINRYVDDWYSLVVSFRKSIKKINNKISFYIFETWEDLSEVVQRYLNLYSDENNEKEFESVEHEIINKIEKISLEDYNQFTSKWIKSSLSPHDKERFEKIFKVWSVKREVNYKFKEGNLYLELGGRIFGSEIVVEKYEDDWYVINTIPRDAYTFASRNSRSYESYREYYICDQLDGVLEFLKSLNWPKSNSDETIFESKSDNLEFCKELVDAELYDFMESHSNEPMTDSEKKRITEILADTYSEVEMKGNPTEWGFEEWHFDDKIISINKYSDSYYLVEEEWSNSWNKDPKAYLCDELESIKYIDFYA